MKPGAYGVELTKFFNSQSNARTLLGWFFRVDYGCNLFINVFFYLQVSSFIK